jgi:peptidoglycan/LPS O-acetylase OafA/YrhL
VTQYPINLRSLDVLRGLLATYVLLGHARWLLWAGHAKWMEHPHSGWESLLAYASASLRYGHEAVMIFFVLSGFFIHLRAAQLPRQTPDAPVEAGLFYRRRAHRLLPPYVFALLITLLCDGAGRMWFPALYHAQSGDALLDANFARKDFSAGAVIPALLLLPSSLGKDFGSNGPLWSLGYEVVYYALYPAWLALRRRQSLLAYGLVPLACLSLVLVPIQSFPMSVLIHFPVWLAGAALAEGLVSRRICGRWRGGLILSFLVAFLLYRFSSVPVLSVVAAALFGAAAVAGFAGLSDSFSRWSWVRAFEFLGVRSYTVYIMHFPFLAMLSAWVIQKYGERPVHGWLAAGGSLLALTGGCLCFVLCEKFFLHRRIKVESTTTRP